MSLLLLALAGCRCGTGDASAPLPLVIGHRGAPGYLPDHTLEGYRLAVEQGADFIEPDLVATADGVLVARHEEELTHTTDVATRFPNLGRSTESDGTAKWFAHDLSLAQLREVRAVQPRGDRSDAHDGRYAVPTFDEVLALRAELSEQSGRTIGVYPELKHPAAHRARGVEVELLLVESLRRAGLTDRASPVFVQSFELDALDRVASLLSVRRILLIGEPDEPAPGQRQTWGEVLDALPSLRGRVDGVGVHKSLVWGDDGPTDLVDRAHAAGLLVHAYTFRDEPGELGPAADGDPVRELERFFELGVDGVFADHPDTAVRARQAQLGR